MLDKIHAQADILGAAMQAAITRNEVISGNIANADTPNYRRKYVTFEPFLKDAVAQYQKTGKLDVSAAKPRIQQDNSTYQYRIDGNGVDAQSEMVDLYANSARYDVLVNGISNSYKRLNLINQIK